MAVTTKWPSGEHPTGLSASLRSGYSSAHIEGGVRTSIKNSDPISVRNFDPSRSKIINMVFQWSYEQVRVFEDFYLLELKNGAFPFRMSIWEERGEFVYNCVIVGSYKVDPNGAGWKVSLVIEADMTGPILSTQAETSLNRFDPVLEPLLISERNAIAALIDALVLSNEWDNILEYWVFLFKGEKTSLVGLKNGKRALFSNIVPRTITHDPLLGFTSDGTSGSFLDTTWKFIQDGGSPYNYDILMGAFVLGNNDIGVNTVSIFGAVDIAASPNTFAIKMHQTPTTPNSIAARMGSINNDAQDVEFVEGASGDFVSGNFYSISRLGAIQSFYKNEVVQATKSTSLGAPATDIAVSLFGKNPVNPTFADELWDGTLSSFVIAKSALDMPTFIQQDRELRTKLSASADVTLSLIRMSGLTQQEIDAITTFIETMVAVDNWKFIVEFYCPALFLLSNALMGFKSLSATIVGSTYVTHQASVGFGTVSKASTIAGGYVDTNLLPSLYPRLGAGYGCYLTQAGTPFGATENPLGTHGFLFGVANYATSQLRDSAALFLNPLTGGNADWPIGLSGTVYADLSDAVSDATELSYLANTQYTLRRGNIPADFTTLFKDNIPLANTVIPQRSLTVEQSIFLLAYNTQSFGPPGPPVAREFANVKIGAWWAVDETTAGYSKATTQVAVIQLMQDLGVAGA